MGSNFWFTARLGKGQEETRSLQPDPDLRGRRVLVVDENDSARVVIADMLRCMTFVVGTVASGKAAVTEIQRAAAAQEPYEIVFLDWQMPGMDGIATAREIRRLPLVRPPHLIMITAHGREEVHKPAEQAGIEDILTKPLNPSLLFDTVMHGLATAQREPAVRVRPETHPPQQDPSALRGARILLVEDNLLNQEVATALLHEIGLEVDIADNGRIAVDKVKAGHYDAVLMDMQMPVLDGLAATREIRQLPGQEHLPILSMTANALAQDRERCIEAGMNDHMTKPIDPQLLTRKLLQWIAPRGQALPTGPHRTSTQRTESSERGSLDGIDGLDTRLGLRQAMGQEKLYLSLLAKFVQSERDWAARMEKALEQADRSSARLLAHTLKGVSAQVGALRIRDLAQALEQAIEQQESAQALGLRARETAAQLAALVQALDKHLPLQPAAPAPVATDTTSLHELCARLVHHLEQDDFASSQLVDEHEGLLRTLLGSDFDPFAGAAHDFSFGTALDLLKKAMARQGMAA
jgi:two-component system sensor histidine kinase/response regulator